ncbi:SDR family NAD(P)-dependent oxidoreductase [Tistrella bauzanensis]|jgi:NAD(P)-dependent dehydrogenase (short-subunit alcohol dehydrogenase family)|uniref:SDR family oxidoreductase n=1 Tax=Tistrella arctica TaxID=3133430 RepID=A0ABU9YPT4_9PROT
MKIDLSNRTAVVSGSTKGIGYAIARGLAGAGAAVVISGRKPDEVEAAMAKMTGEVGGADVRGVVADLGTADGCAKLVDAEPAPDILVNNVGFFGPSDVLETTDDEWRTILDVNFMSGVRLSRALVPGMVDRGWGRVIFLSSESAHNIPGEMVNYGVTKTAYLALSRGLAKRVAGSGVTINAILPGPTLSDALRDQLAEDPANAGKSPEQAGVDFVRANRPTSIIHRAAAVEEVANMAVYVASPQASATTGAALRVDGGVIEDII